MDKIRSPSCPLYYAKDKPPRDAESFEYKLKCLLLFFRICSINGKGIPPIAISRYIKPEEGERTGAILSNLNILENDLQEENHGKVQSSEGSGETIQKETSTCDICQFGAECDEDAEDVWCVCNIDCSQTNFNPLCASDGKSYDNACQIKEVSCQKQEKIEVMSLGRCQ
ncbi:hypothetical protein JRQ81_001469, partial [Phrynocephalus forsythii]